jgi:hypothetical protein
MNSSKVKKVSEFLKISQNYLNTLYWTEFTWTSHFSEFIVKINYIKQKKNTSQNWHELLKM